MKKLFTILMLIPVILFGQNEPYTRDELFELNEQKKKEYEKYLAKLDKNTLDSILDWYKKDLSKENIYAEAHIGLFTELGLNYERQIYSGEKISWYGRLGGGRGGIIDDLDDYGGWGGLGAITMLTGKYNNHFELNAGAFIGNEGYTFIFPIFNVGYRYQKPEGGFIFRANAGIISLGLSFGYAF
jgi:hypothetical protein